MTNSMPEQSSHMEVAIKHVHHVRYTNHDALEFDIEVLLGGVHDRVTFYYRNNDPYSPLTPIITQWLADHPEQEILPYTPMPEPESDPVISIPAVTLWERMTEAEGEQVEAAMQAQPFRTRQIFTTAQTYRSDHELWPLLQQVATELFGEERAMQLLA